MKKLLLIFALLSACIAKADVIKSPNNKIAAEFILENGRMFYNITSHGQIVIERSPLGFTTSTADFTKDIYSAAKIASRSIREVYQFDKGKHSLIEKSSDEKIFSLKNSKGDLFDLIFCVSNDGVAYRYEIKGSGSATIISEESGFKFPKQTTAFITPLSTAKSGWARTNPSYEEPYHNDIPVNTPSDFAQGWTFPALFKITDSHWVLLSETGTDGNYVGTHLSDANDGLYTINFPQTDHNLIEDPTSATVTLPYKTPWRMIVTGDLATIIESTMAQDLVKPLFESANTYKPGRVAWSWIIKKDNNTTYDVQKKYIDMAESLGWEYLLIDALWDTQIGRDKIAELAQYANSKNVGIMLWYNSNGKWNDAPQTPKNLMDTPSARQAEMQWMQSIKVKGIKVDFFGGDKQRVMKFYDDILRDADKYGIMVNFHGTTLPRGWERMYPNFVTAEAVKGQEFITFGQDVADVQAQHSTSLIFTRNTVAAMDFTPMALNPRLGDRGNNGPIRRTSAAFELATPVLFFSPVQHFALTPENLTQFPSWVKDYLAEMPTTWDETRFVEGYPGKYVVLARRKGGRWYIAGINAEKENRKVSIPIKNGKKIVQFITEGDEPNSVKMIKIPADQTNNITFDIKPNGGFVLITE